MLQEETQDTILELIPAREGPTPHCSVAVKGVDVDGPQGEVPEVKDWVTDEGAWGRGLKDGTLGALQAQVQARARAQAHEEVAGCRVGSPEEEPGGGSSHPGGPVTGRDGSAGGGGGGGDGVHWGGDGGGCCCCYCCHCSGGGCCGRDDGGGSNGLSGHADASLEGYDGCDPACGISLA